MNEETPVVRLAVLATGQEVKGLAPNKDGDEFYEESLPLPALLCSYWFLKKFLESRPRYKFRDWALDSGAFSAHNSGAVIDLQEYIDTCLELMESDSQLSDIFALDVIGDHEATLKNTEEMWRQGVEAIPCYHVGEPEDYLYHIAKEFPKIALGGVALMTNKTKRRQWHRPSMINLSTSIS